MYKLKNTKLTLHPFTQPWCRLDPWLCVYRKRNQRSGQIQIWRNSREQTHPKELINKKSFAKGMDWYGHFWLKCFFSIILKAEASVCFSNVNESIKKSCFHHSVISSQCYRMDASRKLWLSCFSKQHKYIITGTKRLKRITYHLLPKTEKKKKHFILQTENWCKKPLESLLSFKHKKHWSIHIQNTKTHEIWFILPRKAPPRFPKKHIYFTS